ncbi:MAG TPA: SIR2 family protein [Solirubrobacteraceae bacterium]|jgi:predicted ATPase
MALRAGKVIPFVGAGISVGVRNRLTGAPLFPDWPAALRRGVELLREEGERNKAAAAARAIEADDLPKSARLIREGLTASGWKAYLIEQFGRREAEADRDSLDVARRIWQLGSKVVITTNYDDVLRWACPHADVDQWDFANPAELGSFLRGEYEDPAVWHLHGRFDRAADVVLAPEAYARLYRNADGHYEATLRTLRTILLTHPLLFIGFSLKDADFVRELAKASSDYHGFGSDHFALLPKERGQAAAREAAKMSAALRAINVHVTFYPAPDGDHSALAAVLEQLASLVDTHPGMHAVRSTVRHRDEFIGRSDEGHQLAERLTGDATRLVALVGPSGAGKTRLSERLRVDLLHEFDRARFADLTDARTTNGLANAVARALGVSLSGPEEPWKTVRNLLPHQRRTLLVLDHFEQLVGDDEARHALRAWRDAAPEITFLVTSTRALDIGEEVVQIKPLPYPSPERLHELSPSALSEWEAVALYVARRSEHDPGFRLGNTDAEAVGRICELLGGLPLAIELAARLDQAPPTVERTLKHLLGWPDGYRADDTDAILEAALTASFNSLGTRERRALIELAVCCGGFFEDEARDLQGGGDVDGASLALDRLVQRGLLHETETQHGRRLFVVPAVRLWALKRPLDEDEARWRQAARKRHAHYWLTDGQQWADTIDTPRCRDALDRLGLEIEDLLAIHRDALDAGDARSAARAVLLLSPVFELRGPASVLSSYAREALEALPEEDHELRAGLWLALARDAAEGGRARRAKEHARAACEEADRGAPAAVRARARCELAAMAKGWLVSLSHAETLAEEAYRLYGDAGDTRGQAWSLAILGRVVASRSHGDRAVDLYDEAEALHPGSPLFECSLRWWRGDALRARGQPHEAVAELERAERLADVTGFSTRLWSIRLSRAIAARGHNPDAAIRWLHDLRDDALSRGNRYQEALALTHLGHAYRDAGRVAEEKMAESIELLDELEARVLAATTRRELAMVLWRDRRGAEALRHVRDAYDLFASCELLGSPSGWLMIASRARLEASAPGGDRAVAVDLARAALARDGYGGDHGDAEVRRLWARLRRIAEQDIAGEGKLAAVLA